MDIPRQSQCIIQCKFVNEVSVYARRGISDSDKERVYAIKPNKWLRKFVFCCAVSKEKLKLQINVDLIKLGKIKMIKKNFSDVAFQTLSSISYMFILKQLSIQCQN